MTKSIGFILAILLTLSLCSCTTTLENDLTYKQTSLKSLSKTDEIKFDNPCVNITISSDETYYFSNKNEAFYESFVHFINNKKCYFTQDENTDFRYYHISIYDGEKYAFFTIYENDVIKEVKSGEFLYYFCDNIYNDFKEIITPFLNEYQKYCRSATTPIRQWYEYVVFDKDNHILESEYSSETPHLFYDSGIVYLWIQSGTGALTRTTRFFDVEKGIVSPDYIGQTDYFSNMVSVTSPSAVIVYDMFSGEEICCFNKFEKPLADSIENIASAYFIEDGTKIIIKYHSSDNETSTQIFDLPQN